MRERERAGTYMCASVRKEQKGSQAGSLHCQHGDQCGAWTHKPWDHDLSWNQELDAYLTEPPRCPTSDQSLKKKKLMLILFLRKRERERERERKREQGRGREEGRHRIWSRLQALSCQHSPKWGTRTHEQRGHDLSQSWRLTDWATQAPLDQSFKKSHWSLKVVFAWGAWLNQLSV